MLPAAVLPGYETDSDDDSGDDASVARHIGREVEREVSDADTSEFEDDEIASMATRMQNIEISGLGGNHSGNHQKPRGNPHEIAGNHQKPPGPPRNCR